MAAYLDTSGWLKLLWEEPETARVVALLDAEAAVVLSDLAWLETKVRVQARHAAGLLTRAGARRLLARAELLVATPPFERRACPSRLLAEALSAVRVDAAREHCRTLDRLHLAAMTSLGLSRLVTCDAAQAKAARALGLEVVTP